MVVIFLLSQVRYRYSLRGKPSHSGGSQREGRESKQAESEKMKRQSSSGVQLGSFDVDSAANKTSSPIRDLGGRCGENLLMSALL